MKSENINELAKALASAQKKFESLKKTKKATITGRSGRSGYSYTYATLADAIEACSGALSENGLSFVQPVQFDGDKVVLETVLMHQSGQWMSSQYPIKANFSDPQAVGSALTYARRYALTAMVGLATEDDDGKTAKDARGSRTSGRSRQSRAPSKPKPKKYTDAYKLSADDPWVADEEVGMAAGDAGDWHVRVYHRCVEIQDEGYILRPDDAECFAYVAAKVEEATGEGAKSNG